MCSGRRGRPRALRARRDRPAPAACASARPRGGCCAGIVVDAVRISSWVRRHDVVVVPGMGTLESTLHERAWQMPWTLLVMALSGRLWGTRVALVGVGAEPSRSGPQRVAAGQRRAPGALPLVPRRALARARWSGWDCAPATASTPTSVLGLPGPVARRRRRARVGLGVMAWSGSNGDRGQAERLHAAYADGLVALVRRLLERGYRVRLLVGDADDVPVARRLLAAVPERPRPAEPGGGETPGELMAAVASVEVVVASRYHNVVCALRCGTPVVALAYAAKHRELLAQLGLESLAHDIRHLDPERLVGQVDAVHARPRGPARADRAPSRRAGPAAGPAARGAVARGPRARARGGPMSAAPGRGAWPGPWAGSAGAWPTRASRARRTSCWASSWPPRWGRRASVPWAWCS